MSNRFGRIVEQGISVNDVVRAAPRRRAERAEALGR
jgi:hypothetical protein